MPNLTSWEMALIAGASGAVVKLVKTNRFGDLLDRIPINAIHRIPKDKLPYVAVFFGFVFGILDAKLNGQLATWRQAIDASVAGVLLGGAAVGGDKTLIAALFPKKDPPIVPPPGTTSMMIEFTGGAGGGGGGAVGIDPKAAADAITKAVDDAAKGPPPAA